MKKYKFLSLLLLPFIYFNCLAQSDDVSLRKQFKWIKGIYKYENFAKDRYEVWYWKGDILKGRSFDIIDKDTTIVEELELQLGKDNFIYYIATVMKQNQGRPIFFKLVQYDSLTFIFENLEHDFPERISYIRDGKNIRVKLQGENVAKTVEFILKKIK